MGGSQQRFFLFLAASFLFLMFWSKAFGPKPPNPDIQDSTHQAELNTSPNLKEKSPTLTQPALDVPKLKTDGTEEATLKPARPLVDITSKAFAHPNVMADLSNKQGLFTRWTLNHFKKTLKGVDAVTMVPMALETIPPMTWVFEISGNKTNQRFSDADLVYNWMPSKEDNRFVLQADLTQDLQVIKTYRIDANTYQATLDLEIRNRTPEPLSVLAHVYLAATKDPTDKPAKGFFALFQAPSTPIRTVSMNEGKVKRFTMEDIKEEKTVIDSGSVQWSGFESQYFLLAFRPLKALWKQVGFSAAEDSQSATIEYMYKKRDLAPMGGLDYTLNMYAGPKDIGILKGVDPSLQHSIELGSWLGPIARLILHALRKLYDWFGNYGVAIILLTFGVRLLMFPLVQKQAKSMKAMQSHKPQMDALKQQYGEDREGYSRALMQYMRTHKINPAGGCFPLIIQMPIFFALYRVLYNSIELRHAPFFGWIQDLSAHDPFFLLPVLVGITFFIQTKFNPTPMGDPTQQAMMKFIPVVFSALMIFLPSGLNLYIFVSTLWGILQQYWVQKSKA